MDPRELSARLGFAHNDLDRLSAQRENSSYIAALRGEDGARFFALSGDAVWLERDFEGFRSLFKFSEMPRFGVLRETVFLGHDGFGGIFAASFDDSAQDFGAAKDESAGYQAGAPTKMGLQRVDLRTIAMQGLVSNKNLGRLAEAKSLLYWHARHAFCAACGIPTQAGAAGWKRSCSACGAEHFPRTDPVAIMLAVSGDACLLGRQPKFPPNMYSALAGFIEPGETFEDAARREIFEETGVQCAGVSYLASQPWPFPCSLMIGCLVEAKTTAIVVDRTELDDARWFSREEVLAMLSGAHEKFCPPKMAIAHHLIAHFERGRS